MTPQGAERAVTTSALIVAGVYIYRRLTEGSGTSGGSKAAQLLGQGSPPSVGTFITAWGAAFLMMSIAAQASPGLGGSFAILAATADVLSNGQQIFNDVNSKVGGTAKKKPQPGPAANTYYNPTITHATLVGPNGLVTIP